MTYNFSVFDPRTIAINAAIVGERPTGLGTYALSVIQALADLGERLVVFTSRPDLIRASSIDVRSAPAAARPERGAFGHAARLLWVQSGLRARVRAARPSLLLNLMPEGLLRPGLPQITTVHDLLPLLYPEEYPRQQYYFRHYVPAVLRHSRAIIAISESTRRDLLHFYPRVPPDDVHVVLSGYDARRFSADGPVADGGEAYALYVGNVMPHKNLLALVEAVALARRHVPFRLVMRGGGRPRHVAAVRAAIEARGLAGHVDWQAYTGDDALPGLYRGARVLLLPSLYEGFGLTALEAMACGTPVVTANTSSLPEVVGDAALLVDPRDTAALADALVRVVSDDALAKTLRARGLARARHFSWERTGRAVQTAITAALGPGRL